LSRAFDEIAYHHHPGDDIEPLLERASSYREAASHLRAVMEVAYEFASRATGPPPNGRRFPIFTDLRHEKDLI
jgi:hypothetical protein